MHDFWEAAAKQGFGIAALVVVVAAVGLFAAKVIWPWLTSQLDAANKRTDEQTRMFVAELAAQRELSRQGFERLSELLERRLDRTDDKIDRRNP